MIAGQAGLKDHIKLGDGVIVMGQSGVFGDVKADEVVSGYPARAHKEALRQIAAVASLPEYLKRVRELEKANADLCERASRLETLVASLAQKPGASLES